MGGGRSGVIEPSERRGKRGCCCIRGERKKEAPEKPRKVTGNLPGD